jgi:hypothetical protein
MMLQCNATQYIQAGQQNTNFCHEHVNNAGKQQPSEAEVQEICKSPVGESKTMLPHNNKEY